MDLDVPDLRATSARQVFDPTQALPSGSVVAFAPAVERAVAAIRAAGSDEKARDVEASLLVESENGLFPGDPEEQPDGNH